MSDNATIHRREADFHDEWARATDLESIGVREAFEAPAALENKFILGTMGSLRGKRLLDIGSGLGESSVYFALQGAQVTTTDISPGMVETAIRLGAHYGVTLEGIVSTAETLNVEEGIYDIVYVANLIHHVHDRITLYDQISRALKPGGRFFASEPLIYNPVVNVYRRMATKVRTPDETPLNRSDIESMRRFFVDLRVRHFWIASLLLFVKYAYVDRIHPNADRYWKRILKETDATLAWWKPLLLLDSILTRLPLLRWWSWTIVLYGSKSSVRDASSTNDR